VRASRDINSTFNIASLVRNRAAIAHGRKVAEDEHFAARGAIVTVDDPELGPTRTADVFPRLTRTPGKVRHLGPRSGADTGAILAELGYGEEEIASLRERKVV